MNKLYVSGTHNYFCPTLYSNTNATLGITTWSLRFMRLRYLYPNRTPQVPVCSCLALNRPTNLSSQAGALRSQGLTEELWGVSGLARKVSGGREGTARLSSELRKPCPCLVPASRTSVGWLWGTALAFQSPSASPPLMAGAGLQRCPDFPSCFQDLANPWLGEQTPRSVSRDTEGAVQGGRGGVRLNWGSGLGQLPDAWARGGAWWGRSRRGGGGQGGPPDPEGFSKWDSFPKWDRFQKFVHLVQWPGICRPEPFPSWHCILNISPIFLCCPPDWWKNTPFGPHDLMPF